MLLSDVKARQAKAGDKPLRLNDGHGLYLEVRPTGKKVWLYRYKLPDKEVRYTIGEYPTVSLQDARRERERLREVIRAGQDPVTVRKLARVDATAGREDSFKAIANEWAGKHEKRWSVTYKGNIRSALDNLVFPSIGDLPIREVTAHHVLALLRKMEKRGTLSYAALIRQVCSQVFRYAVATLRADTDPTFALRGAIISAEPEHAKAMPNEVLADMLSRFAKFEGSPSTLAAVRMLAYTFVRTGEVRSAEWVDMDLDAGLWTIPAAKMKRRRIHVVPLARQAVELLRELHRLTGRGRWVFPGRKPDQMFSSSTINIAITLIGFPRRTWSGHDFRATASTRLHEQGYPSHLIEMQLAHASDNKTAAAYNHAQYLPERAAMLQAWADWIDAQVESFSASSPLRAR